MNFFGTLILACIVLGAGGFVFMTQWDVKVPEHQVEHVVDNERFFNSTTNITLE
ncbi:MAG: hypothetical protein ACQEQL_06780 [Pseudomonadota bacterium]